MVHVHCDIDYMHKIYQLIHLLPQYHRIVLGA